MEVCDFSGDTGPPVHLHVRAGAGAKGVGGEPETGHLEAYASSRLHQ